MATRTIDELKKTLAQKEQALAEAVRAVKNARKKTVELLRQLANDIQTHEDNSRIARLSGSSASIVGTGMAIGGAIAAIFTLGASLIVSLVGTGIAVAGGATVVGTDLVNRLLKNSNVKLVEEALKEDEEATNKFQEKLDEAVEMLGKIEKLTGKEGVLKCGKITFSTANQMYTCVKTGMQLGRAAGEAGETALRAASTATRALHIAGIVFSAVTLVVDIHTLVSTSVEVHNGNILEVVKEIRAKADELEQSIESLSGQNENSNEDGLIAIEYKEIEVYHSTSENDD